MRGYWVRTTYVRYTPPVLVSAEESGLQDGDHVMGLAIDGEARAYPVRELFSREMVNDEVAGVPVLVTW